MRIVDLFLISPSRMLIVCVSDPLAVDYCKICKLRGRKLCCLCKKRKKLVPEEFMEKYVNEVLCN